MASEQPANDYYYYYQRGQVASGRGKQKRSYRRSDSNGDSNGATNGAAPNGSSLPHEPAGEPPLL
jgi:hypothetical protein